LLTIFALCPVVSTRVAAPSIVEVVGVMVRVPTPEFKTVVSQPSGKPVEPAAAMETAMGLALVKVMSRLRSVAKMAYVVPVWGFVAGGATSAPDPTVHTLVAVQ
jgi:hypothetical protein